MEIKSSDHPDEEVESEETYSVRETPYTVHSSDTALISESNVIKSEKPQHALKDVFYI